MPDVTDHDLLIRLDERLQAVHDRLDTLPCYKCAALVAVLSLFGKRLTPLIALAAFAMGAAYAWVAK